MEGVLQAPEHVQDVRLPELVRHRELGHLPLRDHQAPVRRRVRHREVAVEGAGGGGAGDLAVHLRGAGVPQLLRVPRHAPAPDRGRLRGRHGGALAAPLAALLPEDRLLGQLLRWPAAREAAPSRAARDGLGCFDARVELPPAAARPPQDGAAPYVRRARQGAGHRRGDEPRAPPLGHRDVQRRASGLLRLHGHQPPARDLERRRRRPEVRREEPLRQERVGGHGEDRGHASGRAGQLLGPLPLRPHAAEHAAAAHPADHRHGREGLSGGGVRTAACAHPQRVRGGRPRLLLHRLPRHGLALPSGRGGAEVPVREDIRPSEHDPGGLGAAGRAPHRRLLRHGRLPLHGLPRDAAGALGRLRRPCGEQRRIRLGLEARHPRGPLRCLGPPRQRLHRLAPEREGHPCGPDVAPAETPTV
mmetsp:Transcript_20090/g.56956  ORF Transcript_20090/g.56956 Transcript_20090/m.56956 type:complete len:417 (+) Transcript_20090:1275-2525(+)